MHFDETHKSACTCLPCEVSNQSYSHMSGLPNAIVRIEKHYIPGNPDIKILDSFSQMLLMILVFVWCTCVLILSRDIILLIKICFF